MRTATAMPGNTPRSATPAKATIDTTNSIRRCFQRRTVPGMSASDNDAVMTTDARTGWGRFRNSPGTNSSMAAIIRAPVTPVSWLLAPARSATAVRDPLVLTGKPWNSPAARLAVPMPIISWLASTSWPVRSANADDVEIVSVSDTRVMPSAPATSNARSANPTSGQGERREALGQLAHQRDALAAEVEHDDRRDGRDDGDQHPRDLRRDPSAAPG